MMSSQPDVVQIRSIGPFSRISLRDYGLLVIEQGQTESLSVQSHPDVLSRIRSEVVANTLHLGLASFADRLVDSFTTSLTRKAITYRLTVTSLEGLEIRAAAEVTARGIRTARLSIQLFGPVSLRMTDFNSDVLEVESSGAALDLDGRAREQRVTLRGLGHYDARRLCSQHARVTAEGACRAWVWVEQSLDYATYGLAQVEYVGSPKVTARTHGILQFPFAPRAPRVF